MSSHREAPEISKDPVADSTDVYAFVSPDKPDTVTLIANYIPLQLPSGGPNFYEFGDDVLYEIHIDNNGDGHAEISYQFRFSTKVREPTTFLYNTGPVEALNSPNWNRRQFFDVSVVSGRSHRTLGTGLPCPPCNIGPLSTPNYAALADEAVHNLDGTIVFAGQRAEGFYVDLGAIFDLGDLRPFENLHVGSTLGAAAGVNATDRLNVHSIAIQVPISAVTRSGHPTIGVWTTASRQRARVWDGDKGQNVDSGPFRQVSRLGNPLFNEVLNGMGQKDLWNTLHRRTTSSSPATSPTPVSRRCYRSCTPACSPAWLRWWRPRSRASTWRRSCSPAYPRGSSPDSPTTPGRSSRTCCG